MAGLLFVSHASSLHLWLRLREPMIAVTESCWKTNAAACPCLAGGRSSCAWHLRSSVYSQAKTPPQV